MTLYHNLLLWINSTRCQEQTVGFGVTVVTTLMYPCSGGSRISHWGGAEPLRGVPSPPMWALFSKNVCENERIGSCWGAPATPPRSANAMQWISKYKSVVALNNVGVVLHQKTTIAICLYRFCTLGEFSSNRKAHRFLSETDSFFFTIYPPEMRPLASRTIPDELGSRKRLCTWRTLKTSRRYMK